MRVTEQENVLESMRVTKQENVLESMLGDVEDARLLKPADAKNVMTGQRDDVVMITSRLEY